MTSERLAIVLAAGKGTRMKSDLPKVLCTALDRPLVHYVLDALATARVGRILVVVGYRADDVRRELQRRPDSGRLEFVEQTEQLGTGHAVKVCRRQLEQHEGAVLVLTGDSPLTQPRSLAALFDEYERARPACILGSSYHDNPAGLGRIVRDARGEFQSIVEEKDATEQQRQIREVNMSTYIFDCRQLLHALDQLQNNNQQREYYLTDCPGILKAEGKEVRAVAALQPCEALSVNTIEELEVVEAEMRKMGY